MQALIEIVAAVVVWSASVAFAHFGIEIETPPPPPPARQDALARRTLGPPATAATSAFDPCPDAEKARIRRV